MTTDRPYREALPVGEAFRRLEEASGTQFDPRVVEICMRVSASRLRRRTRPRSPVRLSRRGGGR